jgi:hypothetical protein
LGQIYRITADIERVETSVTIVGRRITVRSAFIILVGIILSIGLVTVLRPALGSPFLFLPIGLAPLYLTGLLAFFRGPDGRPLEKVVLDRYRFERAVRRAVNLPPGGHIEAAGKVIDLRQELIPVTDVTQSNDWQTAQAKDIDLPYAIEGPGTGGLELSIGDLHLTITRDVARDRIRVRVDRSERHR